MLDLSCRHELGGLKVHLVSVASAMIAVKMLVEPSS